MTVAGHSSTAPAGAEARRPAVLQVLPSLYGGGVERGTCDVAVALARAGFGSYVASAGGPMMRELKRVGVRHFELPLDSKNPLVMRANVDRLEALIDKLCIDIVHARSRAPAWSAHAAARHSGARFVTTFHGTYGHGNPVKRYYNAIMTRGDSVIAISEFIADHVQRVYGIDPKHLVTIPRGVDLERFDPRAVSPERLVRLARHWRVPEDAPIVLLPGRITHWKGQSVLIEAMARLPVSGARAVLVGGARGRERYRRRLERQIVASNLDGVAALVGDCDDMPAAYKLADVVVSASTDPEAFGRVAAEAQAMGKPVIATDHGGARETVVAGETGWLVPPGDAAALARAIEVALAMDTDTRAAVAAQARARITERISVEAMCEATLRVYMDLYHGG